MTPDATSRQPSAVTRGLALAVLLAFLAYVNSFVNGFLSWDDNLLVVENPHIRHLNWAGCAELFSRPIQGTYLPLRALSYALDYRLWGLNPFGFHVTNLALHAVNVCLVGALASLIFKPLLPRLACALVFALHPLHTEAVTWISGRRDVLSAFFFLLSLWLFAGRTGPWAHLGSLVCFGAALTSKGATVVLPLAMAVFIWLKGGQRPKWTAYLPFVALSAAFVAVHAFVGKQSGAIKDYPGGSFLATMATMVEVMASYVRLLAAPVHLCTSYSVPSVQHVSEVWFLLSLGFLGSLVVLAAWGVRRSRLPAFCLLWFLIALLPVSNFVPISTLKAERYLYLPSVAFCFLAGGAAQRQHRRRWWAAVAALLVCFVAGLTHRNPVWRDDYSLWTGTLWCSPQNWRARHGLGNEYERRGRIAQAIKHQQAALLKNRNCIEAWVVLSVLYQGLGRVEEAAACCRAALGVESGFVRDPVYYALAHSSLGSLRRAQGRPDEAIEEYRAALRIAPDLAEVHFNLGNAYAEKGAFEPAADAYRGALNLAPEHAGARENLGSVLLARGKLEEAAAAYRAALALRPESASLHNNLGNVYLKMNRTDEALAAYRAAVHAGDPHGMALYGLGNAYLQKGMRREAAAAFREFLARWNGDPGYAQAAREKLAKLAAN